MEGEVGVGETAEGLTLDDWKIAGVLPTGGRGMGGEAVIQGEVMQHDAQTPSSQPPCPCWACGDMGQPVPPAECETQGLGLLLPTGRLPGIP